MSLLQPWFAAFLVLAAIPIVLYLLFRRRRNEVDWGASYILRLTLASKKKENFWKQMAIIALRTLALVLVVLAFAQPLLRARRDGQLPGYPRSPGLLHRIIIVDDSRSMLARDGTLRRLDATRGTIAELLTATRSGDLCHLIRLCPGPQTDAVPVTAVACPVARADAQAIAAHIEPSARSVDFTGALRAAADTFRSSFAAQRQLVIITDLCRVDHAAMDEYAPFGELSGSLGVRVAVLNCGVRPVRNLAVEKLSAGSEQLLRGQPTNVRVEVMNFSDAEVDDRRLQFLVDGQQVAEAPCLLPVGYRKTFVFPVTLTGATHRVEARLSDDALAFDNSLEKFVRVKEVLQLLVVVPDAAPGEGFERDEEFLQRALSASQKAPYTLRAQFVKAGQFVPTQLAEQDVVVLCGVGQLPAPAVGELERFVRRGGGLILSATPALAADPANQSLASLLPARWGAPYRAKFDGERYRSIQAVDIPAPLLQEFETAASGDLSSARVYNHFTTQPAAGSGAGPATNATPVWLVLDNGDPLLLERPCGRGTVLMWTSTLGGAWNSLVVRQAYVPLLYRLVNYAAGFHQPPLNVTAGEPLVTSAVAKSADLFMSTPDSQLLQTPVVTVAGRPFVRFEQTGVPGRYDLQDAGGQPLASFSVATLSTESDLRQLEPRELARFGKALRATVSASVPELKQALWRAGDGRELAGSLLVGILVLALLDAFLTYWWFGR